MNSFPFSRVGIMRKQKGKLVKGGRRKEETVTLLLDLLAYWEENFLSAYTSIPLVLFLSLCLHLSHMKREVCISHLSADIWKGKTNSTKLYFSFP